MNEALDVPARELGLKLAAGANLHLAASVGGFVGGDHVTALLATEPLWARDGVSLVMDIGTNTEISLVRHDGREARIWSSSPPSGPALEGGHIASGMRAAEGAIERVAITDGVLRLQVIGGGQPIGLCGSGVLDALAAFVRAGWVDARAASSAGCPGGHARWRQGHHPGRGKRRRAGVRFTQHDVRAVQLAKSAIRTGVAAGCRGRAR